jgi:hypothetical protein
MNLSARTLDLPPALEGAAARGMPQQAAQRWGRMAMASYFVVSATLAAAAHRASWNAVLGGSAGAMDVLLALQVIAEAVSALLFATGRFAGVIARVWVSYLVLRIGAALPWDGSADAIAAMGPWMMGQVAVIASLLLYLGHHDRKEIES